MGEARNYALVIHDTPSVVIPEAINCGPSPGILVEKYHQTRNPIELDSGIQEPGKL